MSRPGLAASRSIDIIEFLALFPERGFTLTEIGRATGINIASCHAVLTRLTERGYLTRSTDEKHYSLGYSLIAIGNAASKSQPLVARAAQAAQDLWRELDVPVLLSAVVGEEILAVLALDDSQDRSPGMWVGERLPLVPPLGAPFLAWSSDDVVDAWIARRTSPPDESLSRLWRRNLELTRQRGYQIGLRSSRVSSIGSLMADMASGSHSSDYKDELSRFVNSLDHYEPQPDLIVDDEEYDVMMIAAPIFDQNGAAAFNLSCGGFPQKLSGAMLVNYAERLTRACLEVMRADRAQRRRPERDGAVTESPRPAETKRPRRVARG